VVDAETAERVHDLLSGMAGDLTYAEDSDGSAVPEMRTPVLTEWVLLVNVADLDTGAQQVSMIHAPRMLMSHVLGLIEIAKIT
jgi:hypothetical protein